MVITGFPEEGFYFGECSAKNHKPHGKGLFFSRDRIRINNFKNGAVVDGKGLTIFLNKSVV